MTFTTEAADPVVGMLAPYTDFARVELPEDDLQVSSVALRRAEFVTDDAGTTTRVSRLVVKSGVDLDNDPATRFEARSGDWDPDWEPDWDPAEVETLVTATTIFDGATTRTEVVTAEDRWTTSFVNARGELIRSEAGTLYPSEFEYDAGGFMTRAIAAPGTGDQAVTEFAYNARGLLEITTDTLGRVVTNTYNDRNLLVGVDLDSTATLAFAYDINDILTTVTLPHGRVHRFGHEVMYRPTTYYPPALLSGDTPTTFTWNLDGQPERTDYPDGAYNDAVYDFAGRLEQLHGYDDIHTTRTFEYQYEPLTNKLEKVTAPDGRWVEFETNGPLPQQEKWAGPSATPTHTDNISAQLDHTYDSRLRLESTTVTGATGGDSWSVWPTYDKDDAVTTMTFTRSGQASRAYHTTTNVNGFPVSTKVVESSTVLTTGTLAYDSFGRITQAHTARGAQALADSEFDYDAIGRIEATTETLVGASTVELEYEYDRLGRLAGVDEGGSPVRRYAYDLNGNRLSMYDVQAGSITYYSYDAQDRLIQTTDTLNAAEFDYEWSERGVLEAKEDSNSGDRTEYKYDAFGNLLKVVLHADQTPSGDVVIEYVIDGTGRRVGRKKDGAWTNKYTAGVELSSTSGIISYFVPGMMISLKNTTGTLTSTWTTYKIIKDARGSIRRIVDATTGVVAQRMDYDEFGNVVLDTNPGFQPGGFAGGTYDHETGLVRFGLRDYDPSVGRWTAMDPQGFGGGDNLYGYCGNDPVNNVDPHGLGWFAFAGQMLTALGGWLGVYPYLALNVMDSSTKVISQHDPNAWQSEFGYSDPGGDAPWNAKGYEAAEAFPKYMFAAAVASTAVAIKLSSAPTAAKAASFTDDIARAVAPADDVARAAGSADEAVTIVSGGMCFAAGTLVACPGGFKRIEDIRVGDLVWSFDGATSKTVTSRVSQLFERQAEDILAVEVGGESVLTTPGHPFYVEGGGWIEAGNLQAGDALRALGGEVSSDEPQVVALRWKAGPATVYNFTVQDTHTYFVSGKALLVHNACMRGETPYTKAGRAAHTRYNPGPGYLTDVRLPSGLKPDAVDIANRIVRELKPNNPRAIQRGWRQVERYRLELQSMYGGTWTSYVDTY